MQTNHVRRRNNVVDLAAYRAAHPKTRPAVATRPVAAFRRPAGGCETAHRERMLRHLARVAGVSVD